MSLTADEHINAFILDFDSDWRTKYLVLTFKA